MGHASKRNTDSTCGPLLVYSEGRESCGMWWLLGCKWPRLGCVVRSYIYVSVGDLETDVQIDQRENET
jgi:hypothetical protein